MSDKVISEELHNSLQGVLRAVFLHPEVGGELHQAAGSLFDALSALAPASSERAAAGEVYLLEDDMGNVLSEHPSKDAAREAAQAMMDEAAEQNSMYHRDIVWMQRHAKKYVVLIGDTGPEGFFNFMIYAAPAPAVAE